MGAAIIPEKLAEEVVRTARTAMGDRLRSIVYFTRANFEQLYLRDDLAQDADLQEFVGHEWRGYKDTMGAYQTSELGEYEYTIRAFENGFLLRVATDRAGVLLTTDGITMQDFEEVAQALEQLLAERAGTAER